MLSQLISYFLLSYHLYHYFNHLYYLYYSCYPYL